MTAVADLFTRLSGDSWRIAHTFSDDLLQANALLHNAAATDGERAEGLTLWCLQRQPCMFGRVAASDRRIHFCVLSERAVSTWDDAAIADAIRAEKRLWKQRAAYDPSRAAHSFVLVVASSQVALAAPDKHLRAFSDRILELTGWQPEPQVRPSNTVTGDVLYLRNPSDGQFYGFRFNVDFFACAGDGRWWHDHRFPGGIAFTANSTGHMLATRAWYGGATDRREWAVKQAMLTIQRAHATHDPGHADAHRDPDPEKRGRATWLRPLDAEGLPLVRDVACPLATMPRSLSGFDWTRYEGTLHTDHAIREEFFLDRPTAPTAQAPYVMDFTYLYNQGQVDFREFTDGMPITAEDLALQIGTPADWTHRGTQTETRSDAELVAVAEQLEVCRAWPDLYPSDAP